VSIALGYSNPKGLVNIETLLP